MGTRHQRWMPFPQPFSMVGERIVKNTSSCRIKLFFLFFYRFIKKTASAPSASPFGWPPTRQIGEIHWIDTIGGQTEHHGDDVCGGSCVDSQRNLSTIPTVEKLRGGSFPFPPEPA